ncbi:MAG: fused MFS/spermidine synthase, partial [Gammaproteobacteria bacterium]|nr:fused MFS/spermidine synthase [Gammaproteobacteria bacterium]
MNRIRPGIAAWYGTVVFISSACLLILEITAGRLLAPYIGVSLYTWTSIIGVILAGLSIGNWLGGRGADRGAGEITVGVVLGLSGVSTGSVLAWLVIVAPWVESQTFGLLGASFFYVAVLFFLPSLLLGVVTPLLTALILKTDHRAGRVVGRMHALAATGSIAGTFLAGYWLVQAFGTRGIIIGTALVLGGLAVPFLLSKGRIILILAAAIILVWLGAERAGGLVNPCTAESRYYCIRVVDAGATRSLVLDHMLHSTNHRDEPELLVVPYVHAMDEIMSWFFRERPLQPRSIFFAGGGGYTHPRAIRDRAPWIDVVVAEIDPLVTATAKSDLFVEPGQFQIHHEDGRRVLAKYEPGQFDVIVTDVFHDLAVPYHLTTLEYAGLVKSRLAANGLYLLNVVDVFPDPLLVKAFIKTLRSEFQYVDVWMEPPPSQRSRITYVLSASNTAPLPD